MKLKKNWKLYFSNKDNNTLDFSKLDHFINVTIPTLFELELYKNKVLPDPYYSTNNWDYQKYEDYHQYYVRKFNSKSKHKFLRLNGVDTISDIYVNGVLVGKTSNCYLSYDFELNNLKEKDNEIIIHIYPSVVEGKKHDFSDIRQCPKYNYESLYIRKPASSFGWDILPRTPLGGIYKSVELLDALPLLKDIKIYSKIVTKEQATLEFNLLKLDGYTYLVEGNCKDSNFSFTCDASNEIKIDNPYLWNIRGYGEQNLYQISIKLIKNNKVVETKNLKYGIRKVSLKRSSTIKEGGSFEFYINDKKVFLLGSNWVPVEAIKHVDNKRAIKALNYLLDLNCNCIRIWGGGTYETDEVYKFCDEHGIFIWQDFMMGCATYPQFEEFQNVLENEVRQIVTKLINHPSICLWAGDNENDLASAYWAANDKKDPNLNVLTRNVIPNVLKEIDPYRPYLPSSPYVDEYAYSHKGEMLSEDHLWGPRDYFKGEFYTTAYPYFTSETGYHGLNSPKSLNKFMKNPWPIFLEDSNPTKEYMCHGVTVKDDMNSPYLYRTRLMADQVKTLFVNDFDNLTDFSKASQISQAEAMKFFIEKMRRDTKRNGGIIWWNILDGWPQVSDAIVDYYFDKKLAYNYIKMSQQDVLLFGYESGEDIIFYCSSLLASNSDISYKIIDEYSKEVICEGSISASANSSFEFKRIKNDKQHHFLIIKYEIDNKKQCINHFHTNIINIDFNNYVKVLNKWRNFKA